uniref:Uncharacterized protein n=1 Tax=Spongospora subterranea TaxID=70186 RepID=A0A0H5QHJ8_9EUKA|eukprot:CRZ01137.1 hypothetical protein [Spongospora subterranea]
MPDSDEAAISRSLAAFQARASQHALSATQLCDLLRIRTLDEHDQQHVECLMVAGHLRYEEALLAARIHGHIINQPSSTPRSILEQLCQKLENMTSMEENILEKMRKKRNSRSISPDQILVKKRKCHDVKKRPTKANKSFLKTSR